MRRHIAILTVLCLAGPALAQEKAVKLKWFGQSYFQVTSSAGTRIVFDPHAIKSYPRAVTAADLVLISHPHADHNQVEMIENRERARVVVGVSGVGRKQEWNTVEEKFKDVSYRTIPLFHDKSSGMERGKNAAFVVEVDGLKFVHLGDLGHELSEGQIKEIGPVDVLMIPVGGSYTINGSDAKTVVEQLKPKRYIIPMHYGTKDFDELVGPAEFLDEQKNVEKHLDSNEFSIPVAKHPAAPMILILGWKKGG